MNSEFEGDISLSEELTEQDFHDVAQNGGTINIAGIGDAWLSNLLGNNGLICTYTKECQRNCN